MRRTGDHSITATHEPSSVVTRTGVPLKSQSPGRRNTPAGLKPPLSTSPLVITGSPVRCRRSTVMTAPSSLARIERPNAASSRKIRMPATVPAP